MAKLHVCTKKNLLTAFKCHSMPFWNTNGRETTWLMANKLHLYYIHAALTNKSIKHNVPSSILHYHAFRWLLMRLEIEPQINPVKSSPYNGRLSLSSSLAVFQMTPLKRNKAASWYKSCLISLLFVFIYLFMYRGSASVHYLDLQYLPCAALWLADGAPAQLWGHDFILQFFFSNT